MSKTYTQPLGQLLNSSVGQAAILNVPAGELWVIRNVDAFLQGSPQLGLFGFQLYLSGGWYWWGNSFPYVEAHKPYRWEGRQALTANQSVGAYTGDPGWNILITGYVFEAS